MPDVWYWTPNAISESLEFFTDIRMSRSAEVRDSYKDATQTLTYSHTISPRIAEEMIQLIRSNATGTFLVPVWPLATFISTGVLNVTDETVFVENENAFFVGQKVYIGYGKEIGSWEQVTVVSLAAQELTFTPGLSQAYVASRSMKVAVAPMVESLLPEGLAFNSTFPVKNLTAQFLSLEPQDLAANPFSEFDSLPLLTEGGVPFSPLTGAMKQSSNLLSSAFGSYEMVEVEDFERRYGTISFHDDNWSDRFKTRQFMHFMRGRDGEAWFPTGQRDLRLLTPVTAASLSVSVQPIAPASQIVGKHLLFRNGDARVAREITSATDVSASVQSLGLTPLGQDFPVTSGVSFLHRCRFDSDTFQFQYMFTPHGLVSRFSAPVIEVP